jgi:hypothetical protein
VTKSEVEKDKQAAKKALAEQKAKWQRWVFFAFCRFRFVPVSLVF